MPIRTYTLFFIALIFVISCSKTPPTTHPLTEGGDVIVVTEGGGNLEGLSEVVKKERQESIKEERSFEDLDFTGFRDSISLYWHYERALSEFDYGDVFLHQAQNALTFLLNSNWAKTNVTKNERLLLERILFSLENNEIKTSWTSFTDKKNNLWAINFRYENKKHILLNKYRFFSKDGYEEKNRICALDELNHLALDTCHLRLEGALALHEVLSLHDIEKSNDYHFSGQILIL